MIHFMHITFSSSRLSRVKRVFYFRYLVALSLNSVLQYTLIWTVIVHVPFSKITIIRCRLCRYCLGWRGGKHYANKQFRREQMKLLGEITPRWQLLTRLKSKGLNFPFRRSSGKATLESGSQTRNKAPKDAAAQEREKVISPNR